MMIDKPLDLVILAGDVTASRTSDLSLRVLGAHKISWMARQNGYSAITISKLQSSTKEEIIEILERFIGPKTIIGISTSFMVVPDREDSKWRMGESGTMVINNIRDSVQFFRNKWGNKLVLGGLMSHEFIKFFDADTNIVGKAENEIVKLLDRTFNYGISKNLDNWDIKTCGFKWDKMDGVQEHEVLPLEISRGCIFSCKFCGWEDIGKKVGTYERSLSKIKEELISNYNNFGTTHYLLTSDTMNDNDFRMNEWCDMLETLPFKIKYSGFMRLDLAYKFKNTTRRLYDTGLRGCHFGVESFHPGASKSIGKSFNGKKGKIALDELFNNVFDKNVVISCSNIVGLPGEPKEYIRESAEWYSLRPFIRALYIPLFLRAERDYEPYQRSEFSSLPGKYGYIFNDPLVPTRWESSIMSQPDAVKIANELNTTLSSFDKSVDSWEALTMMSVNKCDPSDLFENSDYLRSLTVEKSKTLAANYLNMMKNINYANI